MAMIIGGIIKFSLVDYPHGLPCAVIFTAGCNLRCPFCHNAQLIDASSVESPLDTEEVIAFLKQRQNLLQAVVFSGGEPLLQSDLIDYIRMVKDLGYKVKLDTNGTMPDRLMSVIDLADYVAMDIKASPQHYSEACGVNVDLGKIKESVNIIKTRAKDYEFRTTVFKNFFPTDSDFIEMGKTLLSNGTKRYYLQQPHLEHVFDRAFPFELYSKEELEHYKTILEAWIGEVCLRM